MAQASFSIGIHAPDSTNNATMSQHGTLDRSSDSHTVENKRNQIQVNNLQQLTLTNQRSTSMREESESGAGTTYLGGASFGNTNSATAIGVSVGLNMQKNSTAVKSGSSASLL